MKSPSNAYIEIWIEQAERVKKYNPGDAATVPLDEWLSILRELRESRRKLETKDSR